MFETENFYFFQGKERAGYQHLESWYYQTKEGADSRYGGPYETSEKAVLAAVGSLGGQKGGSVKTEAKASAARANGALGGRPKKAVAVLDGLVEAMEQEKKKHWQTCTGENCHGVYRGGMTMKPYPTADYVARVYTDKDLADFNFKILKDQAAELWDQRCAEYVAKNGDVGSCVLGAEIQVLYKAPRSRKARWIKFLDVPPSAAQGSCTWEASVKEVCAWLKAHGIEAQYHYGHMD